MDKKLLKFKEESKSLLRQITRKREKEREAGSDKVIHTTRGCFISTQIPPAILTTNHAIVKPKKNSHCCFSSGNMSTKMLIAVYGLHTGEPTEANEVDLRNENKQNLAALTWSPSA